MSKSRWASDEAPARVNPAASVLSAAMRALSSVMAALAWPAIGWSRAREPPSRPEIGGREQGGIEPRCRLERGWRGAKQRLGGVGPGLQLGIVDASGRIAGKNEIVRGERACRCQQPVELGDQLQQFGDRDNGSLGQLEPRTSSSSTLPWRGRWRAARPRRHGAGGRRVHR